MRQPIQRSMAAKQNPIDSLLQSLDIGKTPSPAQKIANRGNKFGNPGLKQQQGSTLTLYDTLPLDGRTTFNFFEGVGARPFPLSNMTEPKLGVGEAMAIEWVTLTILVGTAVTIIPIVSVNDIQTAALTSLYRSDLDIFQDNNRILKKLSMNLLQSKFNPHAAFATNDVLHLTAKATIQPLIPFKAVLTTSFATVTANTFLMLTLGGHAAILAPKETF